MQKIIFSTMAAALISAAAFAQSSSLPRRRGPWQIMLPAVEAVK